MKVRSFRPSTVFQLSALGLAIVGSASLAFAIAPSSNTATVTNANDYGEGSLRAALASGAKKILVLSAGDIVIDSTLNYPAHRPLTIYGSGQTVKATGDFTLLTISEGANLSITGLNFEGIGGFDISNQSSYPQAAGKGIFVDVRDGQRGQ